MTQTLIEKLEALPRWWVRIFGESKLVMDAYQVDAIIEQAKAEQSEPVAYVKQSSADFFGKLNGFSRFCYVSHGEYKYPLYTAPQPTPQDVIDAERWRYFVEYGLPHMEIGQTPEEAIDQAMKGE